VYCATYNRGLWRSEDAGETWLPVGTPQGFFEGPTDGAIEPRETTFVSVDPVAQADGQHAVWVGTEPSRLYRSTDHGDTFELVSALDLPSRSSWSFPPRPRTHHVQCIAHTSDGCMHLAIEAGAMIRSHDNGRTFKDRLPDSPVDTHVLLTHPLAPRRLYAALGDGAYRVGFRAHQLEVAKGIAGRHAFHATVTVTEITGSESFVHLKRGDSNWVAVLQGVHEFAPGDTLDAVLDPNDLFVFDAASRLVAAPGSM